MLELKKLTALAAVATLAFGLAACGGGGSDTTQAPPPVVEPEPTAYEVATAAIAAAETEADARAAVTAAVAAGITGAQLQSLNMAVANRVTAINAAAAAAARTALVEAAMCDAATAECIAAHDALIAALQADVDRLADDETATNAQQNAAQEALETAQATRSDLMTQMAEIDRSTATGNAVGMAVDAANGLEEDYSAEAIQAAKVAIEEAEEAIGEDDDSYDERIAMANMAVARAEERLSVDNAVMAARTAVEGLASDADGDAVAAVQALLTAAKEAVDGNEHLREAEEGAHSGVIALLQVTVDKAQARVEDEAERMAAEEAEAEKTANAAMAATAAKLYAGISAPNGDANSLAANDRAAAYNNAGTPTGATVDTHILVSNSGDAALDAAFVLSEDKDANIAANHGWAGKRYADPAGGDMVEAVVFSNVEAPKQGKKFGSTAPVTATGAFQYQLASGALTLTAGTDDGERVAFTGVTRTAGTEAFKLPDPNPGQATVVSIPGSYHGVSGTYSCTTTAADDNCGATVAAKGFTLQGGTAWTFKPSDPNARVMDTADTAYASYGWWLHKTENGKTYTASAFVDTKGTVTPASGLDALNGTATYMGGAAGKYALSSSTGGMNDAGHFTARATLEADFTNNTDPTAISGTIDQFIGADGQSRDWKVSLKGSVIADTGGIGNDGTSTTSPGGTVWTIGDDAAKADGMWSGSLLNQPAATAGGDGVPKVATGTFYSTHGRDGRMVGAFGANKQ